MAYVEISCIVTGDRSGSGSTHQEHQAGKQGGLDVELHIVDYLLIVCVCVSLRNMSNRANMEEQAGCVSIYIVQYLRLHDSTFSWIDVHVPSNVKAVQGVQR